ncbi:hypothetical protein ZWY2020_018407 [Hordeum vulgare]|nr:hypothetical protein ZWY2020_018407 [Hordeum vulgare]
MAGDDADDEWVYVDELKASLASAVICASEDEAAPAPAPAPSTQLYNSRHAAATLYCGGVYYNGKSSDYGYRGRCNGTRSGYDGNGYNGLSDFDYGGRGYYGGHSYHDYGDGDYYGGLSHNGVGRGGYYHGISDYHYGGLGYYYSSGISDNRYGRGYSIGSGYRCGGYGGIWDYGYGYGRDRGHYSDFDYGGHGDS